MSEQRFEAVRMQVASLNARDVDGYFTCCTEDVEVLPTIAPIEGVYTGRTGIERFFADLRDAAPDFEVEIERLESVGDKVLSSEHGSATGRASEIGGEVGFTTVYEFRGDKISRIRVFVDPKAAIEAAGPME